MLSYLEIAELLYNEFEQKHPDVIKTIVSQAKYDYEYAPQQMAVDQYSQIAKELKKNIHFVPNIKLFGEKKFEFIKGDLNGAFESIGTHLLDLNIFEISKTTPESRIILSKTIMSLALITEFLFLKARGYICIEFDNPDLEIMLHHTNIDKFNLSDLHLPFNSFYFKTKFLYKDYSTALEENFLVECFINRCTFNQINGAEWQLSIFISDGRKHIPSTIKFNTNQEAMQFGEYMDETLQDNNFYHELKMHIFQRLCFLSLPRSLEYVESKKNILLSLNKSQNKSFKKNKVQVSSLFKDKSYSTKDGSIPRGKINVQFIVRGHFRQQPYGEGSKKNLETRKLKTIWIEPFIKGENEQILDNKKIKIVTK